MANIWLVRDCPHDLSELREMGEVCTAFPKDVSPIDLKRQTELMRTDVFPASTPSDFLLATGPAVMLLNFTLNWLERNPEIKCLVFDTRRQKYRVCHLGRSLRPG